MDYRVKDVAALAGITVRTLHHYDAIGLLIPSGRTESGYRVYSDGDLLRLQQILIGRTLGMPLADIRRMLDDPHYDQRTALLHQRQQLVERTERLTAMLSAVEAALETLRLQKECDEMDTKKLFGGFDPDLYEAEVEQRWGATEAFAESRRRTAAYTAEDWSRIKSEELEIMQELNTLKNMGVAPDDERALLLAEKHRLHIDRWYYPCSNTMHNGLADMYVTDDRFTATIDENGKGVAAFLSAAIKANAVNE